MRDIQLDIVFADGGLGQNLLILLLDLGGIVAGEVVHLPADPLHAGLGRLRYMRLTLALQVGQPLLKAGLRIREILLMDPNPRIRS
jgi:hypothetical protein